VFTRDVPSRPLRPAVSSQPVQPYSHHFVDFTGRNDAVQAVDIKARVTGTFGNAFQGRSGCSKKMTSCFVIDPRPYQAQLDRLWSGLTVPPSSTSPKQPIPAIKGSLLGPGAVSAASARPV